MNTILKPIDALLNRVTTYRLLVYVLSGLLVISALFAQLGIIGISAGGLAGSVATAVAVCFIANYGTSRALKIPHNSESWLITALILACVMPPVTNSKDALSVAAVGLIAMVSKYVLVYRGSHVFNPVVIALLVGRVAGLTPATWWIATPNLIAVTVIIALVVLRKTRHFSLFFMFAAVAVGTMLLVGSMAQGQTAASVLRNAFLSWPLLFLGCIMLTEPITLPVGRRYQLLYAAIVGAIFSSQLHVGRFGTTPQFALACGNVFALFAVPTYGVMLRLKRATQLSPDYYDFSFELPEKPKLRFQPGQYLEWTLPHRFPDSRGNRRSFSIASSPTEAELHIALKHYSRSSSFKTALLKLRVGQGVRAAHVQGDFILPSDRTVPLVLIAGGIGITPFRSMIKYLTDTNQKRNITLIYIASNEADFVYRDIFQQAKVVGLRTYYVTARLETDQLQQLVPAIDKAQVYISGPDSMVQNYAAKLRALAVPRMHVHTDRFTGY